MKTEKAFPNPHLRDDSGITIRDYFAAKAMQGMMVDVEKPRCDYIADIAYEMADAMMKAREQ
jgi:hypothetical protein